jgi:aldose 1-epimerase
MNQKHSMKTSQFQFATLENEFISLTLCNYGAMIYDLKTVDHQGIKESIVLQYASLDAYINNTIALNAVVGPVAGRIQGASYTINGHTFLMEKNHLDTESLHSGHESLVHQLFDITKKNDHEVVFEYQKPKGPSQFPGHQSYRITYTLLEQGFDVRFEGTTTEDTLMNLTQHAYFNLSGNLKDDIFNHDVYVNSTKALKLNEKFSPVAIYETKETFVDFTQFQPMFKHLSEDVLSRNEKGIDDPLLLSEVDFNRPQVMVYEPISRRAMIVQTTYPAVVIYTHNHPDQHSMKYLTKQLPRYGLCFETQFEPNGIHVNGLNDSILRKSEKYDHKTRYLFTNTEKPTRKD